MCISQGAPCILLTLISLWQLPNDISDVNFLTERQRAIICKRIENDIGILNFDDWSWEQAGSVFTNLKTYAEADVDSSDQRALSIYYAMFLLSGYRRDVSQFILMLGIISAAILITLITVPFATSHDSAGMTRRAIAISATISFGFVGSVVGNQFFHDGPAYKTSKMIMLVLLFIQLSIAYIIRYFILKDAKQKLNMTSDARHYQIYRAGGKDLAGDRHPDFTYIA
ncbi:hypothetical protein A0J61_05307 [Choanephora cucurbitarum]|uniref:Uncharacterized protein n=1 Tax=Choanephora cucurbitarum TaxID=101091 RepID=A0A1C7NC17_9FUNG|nr:hypothetical protein A0J61_05307 [Choanephora cucurbitarum]